ncbi:MAG: DUF4919 domain-containing protein [Micavibrio sp.]|nr:DUF4919 domain-containing protein [Micavibrio sp.]
MKNFIYALTACLLLAATHARADDAADKAYLKMVDAAIANPAAGQWCAIRTAYPDTSFYRAAGSLTIDKKTEAAGKDVIMGQTEASTVALKKFLYENFGSVGAHRYAEYIYRWNTDLTSQDMKGILPEFGKGVDYINPEVEKAAAAGLLDCLAKTGTGSNIAGAVKVISSEEEQIMIDQYFHVTATNLDTESHDGHIYHIADVAIPETKTTAKIYFQMDDRASAAMLGAAAPANGTDTAYLSLVAKAQADPAAVNWEELRHIYVDTSFYSPNSDAILLPALQSAAEKAQADPSAENANAYKNLLRQHYGLYLPHMHAISFCIKASPAFLDCTAEKAALKAIIRSIADSGDGKSAATAYRVVDFSEARLLAQAYFGLTITNARVGREQRHTLAVLDVTDKKTGKADKMYFNMDMAQLD